MCSKGERASNVSVVNGRGKCQENIIGWPDRVRSTGRVAQRQEAAPRRVEYKYRRLILACSSQFRPRRISLIPAGVVRGLRKNLSVPRRFFRGRGATRFAPGQCVLPSSWFRPKVPPGNSWSHSSAYELGNLCSLKFAQRTSTLARVRLEGPTYSNRASLRPVTESGYRENCAGVTQRNSRDPSLNSPADHSAL